MCKGVLKLRWDSVNWKALDHIGPWQSLQWLWFPEGPKNSRVSCRITRATLTSLAEIARPAGRYNPSPSESTDEKEILLPTTFFGHVQMEISRNKATPSSHPFLDGIFHYKPSIWGYPHLQKPPNMPENFESFGFRQHAEGPVSSQVNTTCLHHMPKTAAATPSW